MSAQEHAAKRGERVEEAQTEQAAPAGEATAEAEARDADVDALLDEIDDVLETNAEEFVAAFVQKGGQ